jgi:hypothetical protein
MIISSSTSSTINKGIITQTNALDQLMRAAVPQPQCKDTIRGLVAAHTRNDLGRVADLTMRSTAIVYRMRLLKILIFITIIMIIIFTLFH